MRINEKGYIIRISENSLIQMCLNSLEAYRVKHDVKHSKRKMRHLETYGILLGHESTLPNGKTLYCVEMLSIDTSATRNIGEVEPDDEALSLKISLLSTYWPQYEFLGDFHTHPYKVYERVEKEKLYEFSSDDKDDITLNSKHWKNRNYRIGVVLTIQEMQRKSSRGPCRLSSDTIRINLNQYRIWIKCYVAFENNEEVLTFNDENHHVLLDCPSGLGLNNGYHHTSK